jgi:hypothetical protein
MLLALRYTVKVMPFDCADELSIELSIGAAVGLSTVGLSVGGLSIGTVVELSIGTVVQLSVGVRFGSPVASPIIIAGVEDSLSGPRDVSSAKALVDPCKSLIWDKNSVSPHVPWCCRRVQSSLREIDPLTFGKRYIEAHLFYLKWIHAASSRI